jgi:hypothetical protein
MSYKPPKCANCGDSGYVPMCCGNPEFDLNSLNGEGCCGHWEAEACEQCDAYEKVKPQ